MDIDLSERIQVLRFPLIVGVVFIHAYSATVVIGGSVIGPQQAGFISIIVRDYISQVVSRISVPLFFLLSGFLFFYGFNFSKKEYLKKINSRIHSLAIPFLFWNSFILIVYGIAQTIPFTKGLFSGENLQISLFRLFDYINAILGLTRYPIAAQFWFIRDLIILVFMAPLINFAIKKIPFMVLLALLFLWLVNIWPFYFPGIEALFFFSTGGYLGLRKYNLSSVDNYGNYILVAYSVFSICDVFTKMFWFHLMIHNVGILLGVASALYLSRFLVSKVKYKFILHQLAIASFFIFAAHEPFQALLRKLTYRVLNPANDIVILALYFVIPIFVIITCLCAYFILNKLAPNFTKIVTGGR